MNADYTRFTGGKHVIKTTANKVGKYFDIIEGEEEDGAAKVTQNICDSKVTLKNSYMVAMIRLTSTLSL
jgi:hypothetical protein